MTINNWQTFTAIAPVVLVAQLTMNAPAAFADDNSLNIYNWSGYISPELVEKFEAETGIDVTLDTYDSNETLLAKLSAGSSGYDIAITSENFLPIMVEQELIQQIDVNSMPNYTNLAQEWKEQEWDPGNKYSIVWNWGTTSVMVDTGIYDGPIDSLGVVFNPPSELQGEIGMSGSVSELVSLAWVYLDRPQCSEDPEDLQALFDLLTNQNPYVKVYDAAAVAERLASGELIAAQAWSGAAYQARQGRSSLEYLYPQEGVYGWADNMVVPASASNPENASVFINFMMDPENMAMLSNYTGSPNGVSGSATFINEELKTAPEYAVPADVRIHFGKQCSVEALRAYDQIWTRVRG